MPVNLKYLRGRVTETFDAARHDRASFTYGTDRIDNLIKITASKSLADDIDRIFVTVEKSGAPFAGFYVVGPHSIEANMRSGYQILTTFLASTSRLSAAIWPCKARVSAAIYSPTF